MPYKPESVRETQWVAVKAIFNYTPKSLKTSRMERNDIKVRAIIIIYPSLLAYNLFLIFKDNVEEDQEEHDGNEKNEVHEDILSNGNDSPEPDEPDDIAVSLQRSKNLSLLQSQ